jgi:2-polyprenyl-6-methoxyphenol hydroxylase-like FAD-dependent oxidoreductase
MARIVVLGAGVVGLGGAMLLADDGHDVTVLERDSTDPATSPEEAWERWERKGVNQFRLPHLFLARYRAIVDSELPGVAASIDSFGGLRMNPLEEIPESIRGPLRPEDADAELLTARRPVMEAAVGAAASATQRLEVRRGETVESLLTGPSTQPGTIHVTGVRTTGGAEVRADLVVDLMGRRSPMPRLLEEAGARAPHEELEDSGFMYYARHFRSTNGTLPFAFGPALQHVGTITSLTLAGDNGTWGVVLVTSAKDKALLGLRDPVRWDAAVRSLPLVAHWLDGVPLDDKVTTMSKIEDRIRTYVPDGKPVATGVVAVGDAWACSNPSLGRGASFGMLHAQVLRDVVRDVGLEDHLEFAIAFQAATDAELLPWYSWTRDTDRHRLREIEAHLEGREYEPNDERYELAQALGSAVTKDPDLLRLFLRSALVLDRLDAALDDPQTVDRIRALGGDWREEPLNGPSRDEFVKLVTG